MSASVKASNPAIRNGKKILDVTAKSSPDGAAIKRTISGENAELQIKTARDISENYGIVHLHCLKVPDNTLRGQEERKRKQATETGTNVKS